LIERYVANVMLQKKGSNPEEREALALLRDFPDLAAKS